MYSRGVVIGILQGLLACSLEYNSFLFSRLGTEIHRLHFFQLMFLQLVSPESKKFKISFLKPFSCKFVASAVSVYENQFAIFLF